MQLTMEEGIDWMSCSSTTVPCPLGTHALQLALQSPGAWESAAFCLVEQLHARVGKIFARSLDLDPNESEAQSARCGCLSMMNYRFGCKFLLSSHTESKFKCCFIKVKLLHDTLDEMFPQNSGFFPCVSLALSKQNSSTNKLTAMF